MLLCIAFAGYEGINADPSCSRVWSNFGVGSVQSLWVVCYCNWLSSWLVCLVVMLYINNKLNSHSNIEFYHS